MAVHTRKSSQSSSTTNSAIPPNETAPALYPVKPGRDDHLRKRKVTAKQQEQRSPSLSESPPPLPGIESAAVSTPNTERSLSCALGENDMFGESNQSSIRGRNVEDIQEWEEKGLLSRRMSRPGSADGLPDYELHGKEKDRATQVRLEATPLPDEASTPGLSSKRDREAFILLVVLYLLQGIPLGLTFGTLPFLLKAHLSYSQLAIFALATWPYSLKLLWSPIVDAKFVPKWGRRKSWIVPVQAIVGMGLWVIGGRVESWLNAEHVDIQFITVVFGSLILAAATQDIAVDGWALTLLSSQNLSYASTAQTIGLGIGNALSFTVFLALNSTEFANKYFRTTPELGGLVSLGGFMRFWGVVFLVVTAWLAFGKTEDPVSDDDPDMDVKKVYKVMWSIIRLKNIQSFLIVHLVCKIGFQVNESVTSLKLIEKGLSKEDLAVAALLDFPAQMLAGWLAAKWSRPAPPARHPLTSASSSSGAGQGQVLRPWIAAFWARLVMATVATLVVWAFPTGRKVGTGYFTLVVATTLLSSLASTVQFVGITAFHTQIADPLIGGTYMTLLNTVSNLGGTWPKPLILRFVDVLTEATCQTRTGRNLGECVSEAGKAVCAKAGGTCVVQRDGYYIMSAVCVSAGAAILMWFVLPTVRRLQSLPLSAWRVKIPN